MKHEMKLESVKVLQKCGTVVHVAKSGFVSHILSFLCLKMAGVKACDHRMFAERVFCDLYDNRSGRADCGRASAGYDHKICEV